MILAKYKDQIIFVDEIGDLKIKKGNRVPRIFDCSGDKNLYEVIDTIEAKPGSIKRNIYLCRLVLNNRIEFKMALMYDKLDVDIKLLKALYET